MPTKNPAFFLPDVPVLLLGQSRIRQVRMKGGKYIVGWYYNLLYLVSQNENGDMSERP